MLPKSGHGIGIFDSTIFGIKDERVRERLLREPRLTLAKTNKLCRGSESMQVQLKVVGSDDISAHAIKVDRSVSAVKWNIIKDRIT